MRRAWPSWPLWKGCIVNSICNVQSWNIWLAMTARQSGVNSPIHVWVMTINWPRGRRAAILHPVWAALLYKISMIRLAVVGRRRPRAFVLDCEQECGYWQLSVFNLTSLGGSHWPCHYTGSLAVAAVGTMRWHGAWTTIYNRYIPHITLQPFFSPETELQALRTLLLLLLLLVVVVLLSEFSIP